MFLLCLFVSLKRTYLLIRKARQPAPETKARRPCLFLQGHFPPPRRNAHTHTSQPKHLYTAEKKRDVLRAEQVKICLSQDCDSQHWDRALWSLLWSE